MRQLKFRMPIRNPDGSFKEWFYWGFGCGVEDEFTGPHSKYRNCPSEQLTGLQDKNGVDIYEGDILKVQLPMGGFWGSVSKEKIGRVFYEPENAGYLVMWPGGKNQNYVQLNCDIVMTAEIIGNTTENPELFAITI